MSETNAPEQPQATTPTTSGLAIASLVFGILGIFLGALILPWILAIVFGHVARGKIRKSDGALSGNGLSLAGLILGYTMPALGILAAFSLPAYQDYTIRAKASEGLVVAGTLKTKISDFFSQQPRDMSCNSESCPLGVGDLGATKYVQRVSSDRRGTITIVYQESLFKAPNNLLTITPAINGSNVDLSDSTNAGKIYTWQCGKDSVSTVNPKYLPSSCR